MRRTIVLLAHVMCHFIVVALPRVSSITVLVRRSRTKSDEGGHECQSRNTSRHDVRFVLECSLNGLRG
jgi:hypothetical protein